LGERARPSRCHLPNRGNRGRRAGRPRLSSRRNTSRSRPAWTPSASHAGVSISGPRSLGETRCTHLIHMSAARSLCCPGSWDGTEAEPVTDVVGRRQDPRMRTGPAGTRGSRSPPHPARPACGPGSGPPASFTHWPSRS
jgi:hypothetical protein